MPRSGPFISNKVDLDQFRVISEGVKGRREVLVASGIDEIGFCGVFERWNVWNQSISDERVPRVLSIAN